MKVRLDEKLQKEIQKIGKKDSALFKKIQKQLNLFVTDPRHKSLHIHKLSGELEGIWSISITKSLRMTYLKEGVEAYFFDIGTYNEVYTK